MELNLSSFSTILMVLGIISGVIFAVVTLVIIILLCRVKRSKKFHRNVRRRKSLLFHNLPKIKINFLKTSPSKYLINKNKKSKEYGCYGNKGLQTENISITNNIKSYDEATGENNKINEETERDDANNTRETICEIQIETDENAKKCNEINEEIVKGDVNNRKQSTVESQIEEYGCYSNEGLQIEDPSNTNNIKSCDEATGQNNKVNEEAERDDANNTRETIREIQIETDENTKKCNEINEEIVKGDVNNRKQSIVESQIEELEKSDSNSSKL